MRRAAVVVAVFALLAGCSEIWGIPDRGGDENLECSAGSCHCVAPFADCDRVSDNGCETNLDQVSDHCGSCERSCGGAECVAGKCQPVTLTSLADSGLGNAADIALGSSHLFVNLQSAGVIGVRLSDGDITTFPTTGGWGTRIEARGTRLYVAGGFDQPRLLEFDLENPTAFSVLDDMGASSPTDASALTKSSSALYWIAPTISGEIAVREVPLDGKPPRTIVTFPSAQIPPYPLAANSTAVYVGVPDVYTLSPILKEIALDGSGTSTLSTAPVAAVAADEAHVFWATGDITGSFPGELHRATVKGGAATELAKLPASATAIVLDETDVYYADVDGVWTVPKTGGKVVQLAGAANVSDLAVDAARIYWAQRTELKALVK